MLAATVARLPSPLALFHPPQTPYDRTSPRLRQVFVLLSEARAVLPEGAWVTVTSEPSDPALDTDAQHMGVALLPGRLVIPAARFGVPRPDLAALADYLLVVGRPPAAPPGERLLESPAGTVWRRRRP